MKFLLHGNSPDITTGYGVQIGHLAKALKADGHEVAISATFGRQMAISAWEGILVFGCGFDLQSNDRLHMHADHWFEGEPGWIITCLDVWVLKNPLLAEYNVAAWTPIDHATPLGAQPNIRQFFKMSGAVPVAMSQFGADMLRDLDPTYIPLSVDTSVFKPVEDFVLDGKTITPREFINCPDDAFVVGMVAMNKGWARDRKGFQEAFRAFAQFCRDHEDAILALHTDRWGGAEGIDLVSLAVNCGIQEKNLRWLGGPDQYWLYTGYPAELMATIYSAFDVLLAPSHGEGFCVPLIEAQACGTPVIATDFSAQAELVGAGWKVTGQTEWDPAHHAFYLCPHIAATIPDAIFERLDAKAAKLKGSKSLRADIAEVRAHNDFGVLDALEAAYESGRGTLKQRAVAFAAPFDTQRVYERYWRPFIESITAAPVRPELDREPMPDENAVDVICPIYRRTKNIGPLLESFIATTKDQPHAASITFVRDEEDAEAVSVAARKAPGHDHWTSVYSTDADRGETFAQKVNAGFEKSAAPWVLVIGDDVRFHEGWLDAARKLSGEFDVIGTNDTAGKVKNPKVARGVHADHFFVRRSYVDQYGACLDGPGVLAPEAYKHWYTDEEIIRLARARGVFSPCLDSVVEHMHPGYDGDEDARQADPTYMKAVQFAEQDAETFSERLPLIEMQRTSRMS